MVYWFTGVLLKGFSATVIYIAYRVIHIRFSLHDAEREAERGVEKGEEKRKYCISYDMCLCELTRHYTLHLLLRLSPSVSVCLCLPLPVALVVDMC